MVLLRGGDGEWSSGLRGTAEGLAGKERRKGLYEHEEPFLRTAAVFAFSWHCDEGEAR